MSGATRSEQAVGLPRAFGGPSPEEPAQQSPLARLRREHGLDYPLPGGMRDRLPEVARFEADLAAQLLRSFESYGYQRVGLPVFEYAHVLERGTERLDPQEVLRFIEPETGEVVALRPDMTPQIARLVSTYLADAPVPMRLCYQGSVLRRPRARARRQQQIAQAGVELIGLEGVEADFEVLKLAVQAVRRAGLAEFVIDLGHAQIVTAILSQAEPMYRDELAAALGLRDTSRLQALAERSGLSNVEIDALCALPALCGGEEIWPEIERSLANSAGYAGWRLLRQLWERALPLNCQLLVDLAEVRAFHYYSGFLFQLLAEGPGRAVAAGGRYDGLLERYGRASPALGMAIDMDSLSWALKPFASLGGASPRLLVSSALFAGDSALEPTLDALRELGTVCAIFSGENYLEYAEAWQYTHWLSDEGGQLSLRALGPSKEGPLWRYDGAGAASHQTARKGAAALQQPEASGGGEAGQGLKDESSAAARHHAADPELLDWLRAHLRR